MGVYLAALKKIAIWHPHPFYVRYRELPACSRLAERQSIFILTWPADKTGFNRSLLVDWWSIEVVECGRLNHRHTNVYASVL